MFTKLAYRLHRAVVVIGPLAKVSLGYVRFSVDIATPSKISQVCFNNAVGNVSGYKCMSDCRSRGREFDPGLVAYFPGV